MTVEANDDQDSLPALAAAQFKLMHAEQQDAVNSTVLTRARLALARAAYLQLADVVSRRSGST